MLERELLKLSDHKDPALHRRLTDGALDVLVLLSPDFHRLYVSPACEEVMGYSASELLGGRADSLVHEADLQPVTLTMAGLCEARPIAQAAWRMRRRDGTYRWMETRYRRLHDGYLVTGIRDIQDRKEIEFQLLAALDRVQRLAMLDQLTGMPNRRYFMEQVENLLLEKDSGAQQALMIVDLDGFKAINDRYGHPVGDSLLVEIGRRLGSVMSGHLVARLGGDEFAILARIDGPEDARLTAERVVAAVVAPVQCGSRSVETGVSVGIALFPPDGTDHRILMTHADAAMYSVKRARTQDRYRFYSPAVNDGVQWAADLERALSAGEIQPYYQPLVSLDHGRIVAFEALARWIHPVRGVLTPDRFLPLVEERRLHEALFTAILRRAGRDAASWPAAVRLCVDVSPVQLSDRAFPTHVAALLSETQLLPSRVTLEVTDCELVTDWVVAWQVTQDLRSLGIATVLDGFGTGHSGLSTLQRLRVEGLKVDRTFITTAVTGPCPKRYFAAMVELGLGLGLQVTADGIETEEEASVARDLGCMVGQGPHYGVAVPGQLTHSSLEVSSFHRPGSLREKGGAHDANVAGRRLLPNGAFAGSRPIAGPDVHQPSGSGPSRATLVNSRRINRR